MNAAKTSADPVGDFRRFFQVFPEEAVVEMSREILELVATRSYEPVLLRLKSLKGMCRVDQDPEACNTFMTRVAEDKEAEQQVQHASRVHRAVSRANAAAHPTGYELGQFCHLRRGLPGASCVWCGGNYDCSCSDCSCSVVVFKFSEGGEVEPMRIVVGITI